MARELVCPNCGHQFVSTTMIQSTYDAHISITIGGMSNKAWGASRGFAPSTVTLYRRLGMALADVGIDAQSQLFRWLTEGGGLRREVGAAIETPGATPGSVERVARKFMP